MITKGQHVNVHVVIPKHMCWWLFENTIEKDAH